MSRSRHRMIDVAWALLLGATLLLWWSFEGGARESNLELLMAIMVVKSTLIAAVFMDLWRASRGVLALLVGTMIAIGVGILWFGGT